MQRHAAPSQRPKNHEPQRLALVSVQADVAEAELAAFYENHIDRDDVVRMEVDTRRIIQANINRFKELLKTETAWRLSSQGSNQRNLKKPPRRYRRRITLARNTAQALSRWLAPAQDLCIKVGGGVSLDSGGGR